MQINILLYSKRRGITSTLYMHALFYLIKRDFMELNIRGFTSTAREFHAYNNFFFKLLTPMLQLVWAIFVLSMNLNVLFIYLFFVINLE